MTALVNSLVVAEPPMSAVRTLDSVARLMSSVRLAESALARRGLAAAEMRRDLPVAVVIAPRSELWATTKDGKC